MSDSPLLTSAEVAQMLRVHPKHLYRLLRQGLPGHRVGRGHWRFRRAEVLAWMAHRSVVAPHVERGSGRDDDHGRDRGDERIVAWWARGEHARLPGPNRVVLGRVADRWVAHPTSPSRSRSADGLVDAEAPARGASEWVRPTLLSRPEHLASNVLVAGCAPVLGVMLDRLERSAPGRCHWLPGNSTVALDLLAQGTIHVAGVHLEDPETGADHPALVRSRLPGRALRLVRLLRWRTGLVLRPEHRDRPLEDLVAPEIRWVLRERGAGTRRVLERVLGRLGRGLDTLTIARMAADHDEVARAVELGAAEVGVVIEAIARQRDLPFVPLAEEGFDLVVPADLAAEPHVARMLDALDDPRLRREVASLGPYDTAEMGHSSAA